MSERQKQKITKDALKEPLDFSAHHSVILVGKYKRRLGQLSWINQHHLYNYPLSKDEVVRWQSQLSNINGLWLYFGATGCRYSYRAEYDGIKSRTEFLASYPDYPCGKHGHGDCYAVFNVEPCDDSTVNDVSLLIRENDFFKQQLGKTVLPKDVRALPLIKIDSTDCAKRLSGSPNLRPCVDRIIKRAAITDGRFTFIDLFAGIGGFHQAVKALGGKCVFACDINKQCREVYKKYYLKDDAGLVIGTDVKKAIKDNIIPSFDMLCGGFPCQTFSKAGKRKGFQVVEIEGGEKDDRGQLFFRIIEILRNHTECKYVILENVRNLADNTKNWNVVCKELKDLGFIITEDPIIESPHHFGIPQVRERVYILGVRESAIKTDILRSKGTITRELLGIDKFHKPCDKNCVPKLLDVPANPKYFVSDELVKVLDIWEEFLQNVNEVKSPFWLHKAGIGIKDDKAYKNNSEIGYKSMPDWKKKLVWKSRVMYTNNRAFIDGWVARHKMMERSLIHQKFEWNASRDCKSIKQGITQFRQSGVRVKNPDYFPSLVAMNNTPIVWDRMAKRYRYLSPHEASKLQNFCDDFIFSESDSVAYRQLGNSVNVELIKMFVKALMSL